MDLLSPDKSEHLDEITALHARTFTDYWDRYDNAIAGYFASSPYDWETSRIGTVDGRLVTHFGVFDLAMRVGSGSVRVGGAGAVATEKPERGRGHMRDTTLAVMQALRANGYDLSLLFGIPNYYDKFGYVSSFGQHRFQVSARKPTDGPEPVAFTEFTGDVTDLAGLYNRENEGITGTFVRPTFRSNRRPNLVKVYSFDGGYLVAGRLEDHIQVADCAGPPQMILNVARQLCQQEMVSQIEFVFLPPRSRMGEYLQRVDHVFTRRFDRSGGPMIKVVNLTTTLTNLGNELSRRLAVSPVSDYSGTLRVDGDGESALISISDGAVVSVRGMEEQESVAAGGVIAAGAGFGRLVIGDDDPMRICRQEEILLEGDARLLVPILFPDQEPSTILWDRF